MILPVPCKAILLTSSPVKQSMSSRFLVSIRERDPVNFSFPSLLALLLFSLSSAAVLRICELSFWKNPDGWESRIREPFGLTMAAFNPTVMSVELAIKEELPASFLADEKAGKQN